jgi:hypothetical protein
LYILAYQNVNDARYYVPVIVQTRHRSPFKLNFLIDTGASRTQISWSDATTVDIVIRALPPDDSPFTGMGGTVPAKMKHILSTFGSFPTTPPGTNSIIHRMVDC